ncbi:hypothetical protein BDW42DRAFT_173305 [Aspergillus taichungensis]|uniref:Uncharacterized protein n=1 Tax=Aspergillus taichungensis TaxID=482145 RepID=A0A2J5HPQ1_9EURO|nr:hypothetical protein BDW42DRAFT_173305 [Aspergillus taichungensis]
MFSNPCITMYNLFLWYIFQVSSCLNSALLFNIPIFLLAIYDNCNQILNDYDPWFYIKHIVKHHRETTAKKFQSGSR